MSTIVAPSTIVDRYSRKFANSRRRAEQARELFPNGVTHDLRYLEPFPVYIDRAKGSRKWDIDGHEFIDYWSGHGALLLGHCHPDVVAAVQKQVERATHAGGCHEYEIEWGRLVKQLVPSAERLRFTASGTETTLMALRLSRMFTGRPKVLKFAGHFHGWHDFVAAAADPPYFAEGSRQSAVGSKQSAVGSKQSAVGSKQSAEASAGADFRLPTADCRLLTVQVPGVHADVMGNTVVIPPNDVGLLEETLAGDLQVGAVILEPTGGHWGAVPIRGEFLRALRELTAKHGQVLIFDEVITGFRVAPGGAQEYYGVTPDLTTLAKIVAGGLPGGCLAGRADLLAQIETRPGRPKMRHPGTFNANPLSASAGVATLKLVATGEPCRWANALGRLLRNRLNALFAQQNWPWIAYGDFSMFRLLSGYNGPHPEPAKGDNDGFIPYGGDINQLDGPRNPKLTQAFRQAMLLNGVDIPGLGGWLTAAHTEADVDATVTAVAAAVEMLTTEGVA
jgi:glutamate-1-semialdehyde 2,1-aminomutase